MIGKWTNWWKVETWGTELDSKCEKKITNKSWHALHMSNTVRTAVMSWVMWWGKNEKLILQY